MSIKFENLSKYGFTAIQTDKNDGNIKEEKSLNKIVKKIKINKKYLVKGEQTHSTNILCISDSVDISNIKNCDGYITNDKKYTLLAYFADCMPIFLVDKKTKTFGLLHGGWRGSSNKILEQGINIMKTKYSSNVSDIIVTLGISISVRNYEISCELANDLINKLKFDKIIDIRDGKYYLDIAMMNKLIAIENGILENNIILNDYCTYEGDFFSYRKDKTSSRMAAIIKVGE